jgi:hypothetical protein
MAYTFDEQIVSDLHKDAYGFRPTSYFWSNWNSAHDAEKQIMWDDLIDSLERACEEARDDYARAETAFADLIQMNRKLGAADTHTAIRWILQARNYSATDLAYGSDYVAYLFDLPYKGQFDAEIAAVLAEMNAETV